MTIPLACTFLAGIVVGWMHDHLGRIGGTVVLLASFVALGTYSFIAPAGAAGAALIGLEAFVGFYAGIAAHGLWQHFRSRRATRA